MLLACALAGKDFLDLKPGEAQQLLEWLEFRRLMSDMLIEAMCASSLELGIIGPIELKFQ